MTYPHRDHPSAAYVTVLVSTAGTSESGPERDTDGRYRLGPPLTPRSGFVSQEQAFSAPAGQTLPLFFQAHLSEARSLADLASGLAYVRAQPFWAISRHHPAPAYEDGRPLMRGAPPLTPSAPSLVDVPKSWVCVEVDLGPERVAAQRRLFGREVSGEEFRAEPVPYLTKVRSAGLPASFSRARCYWSIHLSAAHLAGVRAQLWFWLQEPRTCAEVWAALSSCADVVDLGTYHRGRLIWAAKPPGSSPARGPEDGFLPGEPAVALPTLAADSAASAPYAVVRLPGDEHALSPGELSWFLSLDEGGCHADLAPLLVETPQLGGESAAEQAGALVCALREAFPYASAGSLWALVRAWLQRAGLQPPPQLEARGMELAEREAALLDPLAVQPQAEPLRSQAHDAEREGGRPARLQQPSLRSLGAADLVRLSLECARSHPDLEGELRALLGAAGRSAVALTDEGPAFDDGCDAPPARAQLKAALRALAQRYPQTCLRQLAPWLCYRGALSARAALQVFLAARSEVAPQQGLPGGSDEPLSSVAFLPLRLSADGRRLLDFAVSTDQLAADFVAEHDGQLLYSDETWFRFAPESPYGGVWRPLDSRKTPQPLLAEYARDIIATSLQRFDVDSVRMAEALEACRTARTIQSVRSHYPHVTWDVHPGSLNTPLGLVDLASGERSRATPFMYLRQMAAVAPHGRTGSFVHPPSDAAAYHGYLRALGPQLLPYLVALSGESDLSDGFVRFLQVALGMSLLGARSKGRPAGRGEGCTFLCLGDARAGHGPLLQAVHAALGPAYARGLSADDLACAAAPWAQLSRRVRGARLSWLNVGDGTEIAEGALKAIQSTYDNPACDGQRGQEEVLGLCTWITAGREYAPEQLGADGAQVRVLPFSGRCSFAGGPLPVGLRPVLLTWMIEGAMEFCRVGALPPCRRVEEATADRCQQGDVIQEFLDECFILEDSGRTTREELWQAYRSFCSRMGQPPLTRNALYAELRRRGFKESRSNNPRLWLGLSPVSTEAPVEHYN